MLGMEVDFNEPYTWVVGIVVFMISYMYISKEPWRGLPPGPPRLPLVGSLPFLGADMREPLKKMAAKYGNIFTVYLGPQRAVVLNGYDVISEALAQRTFAGRLGGYYLDQITKGHGVILNSGALQREQRHYALQVLKDFGLGRSILENVVLDEADTLVNKLMENTDKPYSPHKLFKQAVTNVMSNILLGKRFEYTDDEFHNFIDCVEETTKLVGTSNIVNMFKFLRYMPGDMFGLNKLMNLTNTTLDLYQGFMNERKTDFSGRDDFIRVYLAKLKEEQNNPDSTFSEKQLLFLLHELFGAGVETTGTGMSWIVAFMTLNQDCQSRVHAELDDIVDGDVEIKLEHRRLLPYTDACFSETLRLADISPLAIPHYTMEDTHLGGYFIPKDTMVIANLYNVHKDAKLWPEPYKFNPNRFLDKEGKPIKRKEFIPFGTGKRVCLGESLARMELFLYFTAIMKKFRFLPAPGYPLPDLNGIVTLIHGPNPFHVLIQQR